MTATPSLPLLIQRLREAGIAVSQSGAPTGDLGEGAEVIRGITADSRAVRPGFAFAALQGAKVHGAAFAATATAAGAAMILTDTEAALGDVSGAVVIRVDNARRALALLAATLHPGQPEVIVAVTGTSGKTSVADFTRQLFTFDGKVAASVGTVGVITPGGATYGSLTTPDPVSLHQTLDTLAGDGVTHLAFEASSHGLDQYRLDGVHVMAGAFTNLGRDHLDYHATIEDYFQAKMRLFRELIPKGQPAVINMDGTRAGDVEQIARDQGLMLVRTGRNGREVRLRSVARDGFRQVLDLEFDGVESTVRLPLVGAYQVENAMLAAGAVWSVGMRLDDVCAGLEKLTGVPGRLEIIGEARGGLAVVDYAHKPEALAAALDAMRPFATGRLICVFGCGGDRDRGKRPIMGRIAAEKADVVIVTDDNPRTEAPAAVRAEILADAAGAIEIGDRRAAIGEAVGMLREGDVVVVAGKGHETGQIVGDKVLPFSDQDEVRAALAAIAAAT